MDYSFADTSSLETIQNTEIKSRPPELGKLLDAAITRFNEIGIRETTISEIIEEAGVSVAAYNSYFESKEELVVAALEKWDTDCRAWLARKMTASGKSGREQILGLFDALFEWFQTTDYRGCLFINSAVEYKTQTDPVHQTAAAHKKRFARHVEAILTTSGASDPTATAEQLMLIVEGAIVTAHTTGSANAGQVARELANRILQHALPDTAK